MYLCHLLIIYRQECHLKNIYILNVVSELCVNSD